MCTEYNWQLDLHFISAAVSVSVPFHSTRNLLTYHVKTTLKHGSDNAYKQSFICCCRHDVVCLPMCAFLTWKVTTEVSPRYAIESITALNLYSGSPIPV